MGRSVNYLSDAKIVIYVDTSDYGYGNEIDDNGNEIENTRYYDNGIAIDEFDTLKEYVIELISEKYPRFNKCNKWEGNEVHIIAENSFVNMAISEYCGLTSISFAVKSDLHYSIPEILAEQWLTRVSANITKLLNKALGNTLTKVGTFSNGECVFNKAS